jgi:hypothetical protein
VSDGIVRGVGGTQREDEFAEKEQQQHPYGGILHHDFKVLH